MCLEELETARNAAVSTGIIRGTLVERCDEVVRQAAEIIARVDALYDDQELSFKGKALGVILKLWKEAETLPLPKAVREKLTRLNDLARMVQRCRAIVTEAAFGKSPPISEVESLRTRCRETIDGLLVEDKWCSTVRDSATPFLEFAWKLQVNHYSKQNICLDRCHQLMTDAKDLPGIENSDELRSLLSQLNRPSSPAQSRVEDMDALMDVAIQRTNDLARSAGLDFVDDALFSGCCVLSPVAIETYKSCVGTWFETFRSFDQDERLPGSQDNKQLSDAELTSLVERSDTQLQIVDSILRCSDADTSSEGVVDLMELEELNNSIAAALLARPYFTLMKAFQQYFNRVISAATQWEQRYSCLLPLKSTRMANKANVKSKATLEDIKKALEEPICRALSFESQQRMLVIFNDAQSCVNEFLGILVPPEDGLSRIIHVEMKNPSGSCKSRKELIWSEICLAHRLLERMKLLPLFMSHFSVLEWYYNVLQWMLGALFTETAGTLSITQANEVLKDGCSKSVHQFPYLIAEDMVAAGVCVQSEGVWAFRHGISPCIDCARELYEVLSGHLESTKSLQQEIAALVRKAQQRGGLDSEIVNEKVACLRDKMEIALVKPPQSSWRDLERLLRFSSGTDSTPDTSAPTLPNLKRARDPGETKAVKRSKSVRKRRDRKEGSKLNDFVDPAIGSATLSEDRSIAHREDTLVSESVKTEDIPPTAQSKRISTPLKRMRDIMSDLFSSDDETSEDEARTAATETVSPVPILPVNQLNRSHRRPDELEEKGMCEDSYRPNRVEEETFTPCEESNASTSIGESATEGKKPDSPQPERSRDTMPVSDNSSSYANTVLPLNPVNAESLIETIPPAVACSVSNTQSYSSSEGEPSTAKECGFSAPIAGCSDSASNTVPQQVTTNNESAEQEEPAWKKFIRPSLLSEASEEDLWVVVNRLGPSPRFPGFMKATPHYVFERARQMVDKELRLDEASYDSDLLLKSCPVFASRRFTQSELHFYTAIAEIRAYIMGDHASYRERLHNVRIDSLSGADKILVEDLPPWCVPNVNGRVIHDGDGLVWEWGVRNGARFIRVPTWEKAFEILHPDLYALALRDRSQHELIRKWDENAEEILRSLQRGDQDRQSSASLNVDGIAGVQNSSHPNYPVLEIVADTSSALEKDCSESGPGSGLCAEPVPLPGCFPTFDPNGPLHHDSSIDSTLQYLKFRPVDANIPMNQMFNRMCFAQMCYFIQRRAETRPIVLSHGLPVRGSKQAGVFQYQFSANQSVHGTAFTIAVRVIRNFLHNRSESSYKLFADIIRDGYTFDEASRKRWHQLLALFDEQHRTSKRNSQKGSRGIANRSSSIIELPKTTFRPAGGVGIP